MQTTVLQFDCITPAGTDSRTMVVKSLVIGGWTARDEAAVHHHIEELKAIGVPAPSKFPLFYMAAVNQALQADTMQVVGPNTSGEAEFVLVQMDGELWVTAGSDHTDRKTEAYSVAISKQVSAKMIGRTLWRVADVLPHWDKLVLRSHIIEGGKRVPYQDGTLAAMRPHHDIIGKYTPTGKLAEGTILFCGTLAAIGGVRPAPRFEMELLDPVLGRSIPLAYNVQDLDLVA
jgi:hypothetical protein